MIELINGDCLVEMDKLIAQGIKVDLTVTSPPYDDLRIYEGSLDWGEHIWKPVIEKLYQITKVGGVVVWVVGDSTVKGSETGTSFKQALYFMQIGFRLHDTMIYKKNNYMPLNHNRYDSEFEYMFVFSKGKPKTFNPLLQKCKTAGASYNYVTRSSASSKEKNGALRSRDKKMTTKEYKYKGNIWGYDVGKNKGSKDDIWTHPATFPEQLAKDHIISWSNEGDMVFDPFMGSGTTGKMAKMVKRNYIGIEQVKSYFIMSKERIANVVFQEGLLFTECYVRSTECYVRGTKKSQRDKGVLIYENIKGN